MSSRVVKFSAVAAILGLAACERLLDPMFPSDAEQFSPPAVYSRWWNMTQACSGLNGSLDAIDWFKTTNPLRDSRTGEPVGGYWNLFTNRIVLTAPVVLDGSIVRHEMLHALLRQAGHPRNQYLGKCLGTVACQGTCIRDAGPYPQPPEAPVHVTGDSLDINVYIEPGNPNSAHDGGLFSMIVLVHNRSTHWVTVPNYFSLFFPGVDTTSTFQFDVRGPAGGIGGGEVAFDPSEKIFAPRETKKQIFDFAVGNDLFAQKLPPGNYTARGGYSDYWSAYSSFVIGP